MNSPAESFVARKQSPLRSRVESVTAARTEGTERRRRVQERRGEKTEHLLKCSDLCDLELIAKSHLFSSGSTYFFLLVSAQTLRWPYRFCEYARPLDACVDLLRAGNGVVDSLSSKSSNGEGRGD